MPVSVIHNIIQKKTCIDVIHSFELSFILIFQEVHLFYEKWLFQFFNEHKVPLANKKKKDKDVKNPCPKSPVSLLFLEILDVARISMFLLFLINYQAVVSDLAEEDRYTVQQTYTCNTYNKNLCKLLHILEIKPLSMNYMC